MTDLSDYLRGLQRKAGMPSTRTLARKTGISHSTIADALNGKRPAQWQNVLRLVDSLNGDPDEAMALWEKEVAGVAASKRVEPQMLDCCICLYDLRCPQVARALTIIEGFAVCRDHMGYVAQGKRWRSITELLGP